jgi:hypothetical protein
VLLNRADNAAGTIDLSITQTDPAEGVSGSGVLATITLRGRAAGTSEVTIEELILVDDTFPVPATMPASQTGATVTIGSTPTLNYLYTPFLQK